MMQDDRQSWNTKEEDICDELIKFLNLTEADYALLKPLQATAEASAGPLREEFLQRIMEHPNTREYFEGLADKSAIDRMFCAWFVDLFSGKYDGEYTKRRTSIGRTHVRIGLPVRYPLAMFEVVLKHGEKVCATAADPAAAIAVFRKVLSIDVAIFNQAYENNQLLHISELVGGERLARRLLMGMK